MCTSTGCHINWAKRRGYCLILRKGGDAILSRGKGILPNKAPARLEAIPWGLDDEIQKRYVQPCPPGGSRGFLSVNTTHGFRHDGGFMSFVRVWIHAVWGTKDCQAFLAKEIRKAVIQHIRENARDKGIYIDRLNGSTDHLHCLFGLHADISISKTLQLIKGESSFWINKNSLIPTRFEWAAEYYAVSVSESDLDRVRAYIDRQEEHHRKRTFAEEVDEFLREYNFSRHG